MRGVRARLDELSRRALRDVGRRPTPCGRLALRLIGPLHKEHDGESFVSSCLFVLLPAGFLDLFPEMVMCTQSLYLRHIRAI